MASSDTKRPMQSPERFSHRRSMQSATRMPPPMHMVASPSLRLGARHLVQQGDEMAPDRGPDGTTNGDGTIIRIHLVRIEFVSCERGDGRQTRKPDPQIRFTREAGASFAIPAWRAARRAGFCPAPPSAPDPKSPPKAIRVPLGPIRDPIGAYLTQLLSPPGPHLGPARGRVNRIAALQKRCWTLAMSSVCYGPRKSGARPQGPQRGHERSMGPE